MPPIQPMHLADAGTNPKSDRLFHQALLGYTPGVFNPGHLEVTEGAGMQVEISAGVGVIAGTQSTDQGDYVFVNDGPTTRSIGPSDPTLVRTDLVVATITDIEQTAAASTYDLVVIPGTPGAGAPTPPPLGLVLATVAVPAGASTLSSADITDMRSNGAGVAMPVGGVRSPTLSASMPPGRHIGELAWQTDTGTLAYWTGAEWTDAVKTTRRVAGDQAIANLQSANGIIQDIPGFSATFETRPGYAYYADVNLKASGASQNDPPIDFELYTQYFVFLVVRKAFVPYPGLQYGRAGDLITGTSAGTTLTVQGRIRNLQASLDIERVQMDIYEIPHAPF